MGFDTAVLEARVRSRCDMVGSGFVTSAEVQLWLEAAWQELYGFACSQNEDLFVKVVNLTAVAGTGDLVLPSDLKHLRGLRIQNEEFLTPLSIREIQNLDRVGRRQRPRYYWLRSITSGDPAADLLPYCDRTYTITCYYQPVMTLGFASADPNFLQRLASWDEYVVLSAAIKCKDKEESSVAVLVGERTALFETMQRNFTPIDKSEAPRVVQLSGNGRYGNMRAYDYQGPDDDY
jgi:hypothetical protein